MPTTHPLTTAQLRQALALSEQIDTMQRKLATLLGGAEPVGKAAGALPKGPRQPGRGGKRAISDAGREKIAAAARARWAKIRAGGDRPATPSAARSGRTRKAKAAPAKATRPAKPPAAADAAAPLPGA